jgi:hypothetical protein
MAEWVHPYSPRLYQRVLHQSLTRRNAIVIHRRAGKTVFCVNELILKALQKPNGRFAYIAPQRMQAKDIVWDFFKTYTKGLQGISFNESELRCDFPNGARITLYGCENPEALRGKGWDGAVLDECQDIPEQVYSLVIFPALQDKKGWVIFVGTPKGKGNNLLWLKLKEANANPAKWFSAVIPITRSGVFNEEEIAEIREGQTEEAFEQEFMCSFEGAIPGAFYVKELSRLAAAGHIGSYGWNKAHPVHTAWDLGMADATAIWFFQIIGNEIHLIDYEEGSGLSIPDWCSLVNSKPYNFGSHIAPHDIEVRSNDLFGAPTRREIARNYGIDFDIVIPRMSVIEGINAARVMLDRCRFNEEKTERGISCLKQCRPIIDKHGVLSPKPVHDEYSHGSDAFRYLALGVEEVRAYAGKTYDWRRYDKPDSGWNPLEI